MLARTRFALRGRRVTQLLTALGLPREELYALKVEPPRKHFWERYDEWELRDFLLRAHEAYRQRIKLAHPDRGGTAEEAAAINNCWKRVREMFKRRGITL